MNFVYAFRDGAGSRGGSIPKNDPRLLEPVRVRVLKPFLVGGRAVEIGTVIEIPRFDGESLAALGKVELT